MKVYKWPLLLLLLGVNQVIRTPFTLWNWSAQMKLRSSGFESVVYKTNSSRVEVFEKSLVAVGNEDSKEHSIKTNSGDTPVLVILSDMQSSVGFWRPWLDELPAVTWVGFAPLDSGSVAEIQDCSGEVQWTCKDDFNNLVQKVVSNRQADSKDDVSSE